MAINDRGAAPMTHRRNFLIGIVSLIAAPAVVRADALMPIRVWRPTFGFILHGGGMGSWVTCKKSELIGVDLASLGLLSPGYDLNGPSRLHLYWRPEQAPIQWRQATREFYIRRDAAIAARLGAATAADRSGELES